MEMRNALLVTILFTLLGTTTTIAQSKQDSSYRIFVQGGVFDSMDLPSISGPSINVGFIKETNRKRDWGVATIFNFASSDEITERVSITLDTTLTVKEGGDRKLSEFELSIFLKRDIWEVKRFTFGLFTNFGFNYRNENIDPDLNGAVIKQNTYGVGFHVSPFIELDLSSKISVFADADIFRWFQGRQFRSISPTKNTPVTSSSQTITDGSFGPSHFHIGIQYEL